MKKTVFIVFLMCVCIATVSVALSFSGLRVGGSRGFHEVKGHVAPAHVSAGGSGTVVVHAETLKQLAQEGYGLSGGTIVYVGKMTAKEVKIPVKPQTVLLYPVMQRTLELKGFLAKNGKLVKEEKESKKTSMQK